MRKRWTKKAQKDELIRQVHDGSRDIAEVAQQLNMDLVGLSDLAQDEQFGSTASALRLLSQWRLESFLNRYQIHAIARLVELSNQTEDLELARKASVDLVKANLRSPGLPTAAVAQTDHDNPTVDTSEVLQMLGQLGVAGQTGSEVGD